MNAAVAAADDDRVDRAGTDPPGRPLGRVSELVPGHELEFRRDAVRREAAASSRRRSFGRCRSAVPEAGFTSATTLSPDAAGCAGVSTVSMLVLTRSGGLAVCVASTLMSRRCHVQEKLCRAVPAQKGFQVGSPVNLR